MALDPIIQPIDQRAAAQEIEAINRAIEHLREAYRLLSGCGLLDDTAAGNPAPDITQVIDDLTKSHREITEAMAAGDAMQVSPGSRAHFLYGDPR